jgi:hypothetical protein
MQCYVRRSHSSSRASFKQPTLRSPYFCAGAECARPLFRPSQCEGMERREALGACEAPLADLAIGPPARLARACARFAINALRLQALHAVFIHSGFKISGAPGSGVTSPARRPPHPVPPSQRLATTPSSGQNAIEDKGAQASGDKFCKNFWSRFRHGRACPGHPRLSSLNYNKQGVDARDKRRHDYLEVAGISYFLVRSL